MGDEIQSATDVVQRLALRVLLGPGHSHVVEEEEDHDHAGETEGEHDDHDEEGHGSTQTIRIIAIFVILASGLIGGLPPLFMKVLRGGALPKPQLSAPAHSNVGLHDDTNGDRVKAGRWGMGLHRPGLTPHNMRAQAFRTGGHPLPRLLRALSAGVIISLAFVHIFPVSVLDMGRLARYMPEDYPYNAAGVCACFGVILMMAADSITHWLLERRAAKAGGGGGGHSHAAAVAESAEAAAPGTYAMGDPHQHVCMGRGNVIAAVPGMNAPASHSFKDHVSGSATCSLWFCGSQQS